MRSATHVKRPSCAEFAEAVYTTVFFGSTHALPYVKRLSCAEFTILQSEWSECLDFRGKSGLIITGMMNTIHVQFEIGLHHRGLGTDHEYNGL